MIILHPYSKNHKHRTWWASLNNLAINQFPPPPNALLNHQNLQVVKYDRMLDLQRKHNDCYVTGTFAGTVVSFLTNCSNREYTKTPDMSGRCRHVHIYSYSQKNNLLANIYLRKRSSIDKYSSSYQWKGKHLNPNLTAFSPLIPILWKRIMVKFRELAYLKFLNVEDGYAVQEQIRWHFLN